MLKEAGKGSVSGGGGKARSTLVVFEVALAVVLLIGAGLLIKSFQQLLAINPGFNPDGLLTMRVNLPTKKYTPAQAATFSQRLLSRIEELPVVQSSSLSSDIPLGEITSAMNVNIEGRPLGSPGSEIRVNRHRVSAKFFTTMGIPLAKGREFTPQDGDQTEKVVIIGQSMARSVWPGEDPIGKRIKSVREGSPWLTVVGVVENVKYRGLPENPDNDPDVYLPLLQDPALVLYVAARTNINPLVVTTDFRNQIQALDPDLPVFSIATMQKRIADKISQPRFNALLMATLAFIALMLAIVGVYGIISYSVSQRTPEIGIRMALGAQQSDILKMVMSQGMKLIIIGLFIGLAVALSLTRILSSLLYSVSATDPIIYAGISLLLVGVGFMACLVPAQRAMRVNPMTALHYQ
jgi:putative ABC transport system permease protein